MCLACRSTLKSAGGVLKLPLIKNKKTVNPRDASTPAVFQLETAMGSAIECFENSGAVVVPRERFAPVKTCNDLFILRSDAYKVGLCGECTTVAGRIRCAHEMMVANQGSSPIAVHSCFRHFCMTMPYHGRCPGLEIRSLRMA